MKFLILLLLPTSFLFAQTSPELPTEDSEVVPVLVKPEVSEVVEVIQEAEKLPEESKPIPDTSSAALREESLGTMMVGYQFISTWIPSKKSLSYSHIFNKRWSLEGEYSWSSLEFPVIGIDLGEIREKRYTLQLRHYVGNSFHYSFGAVYNDFKARLGSDFLDGMGQEIKSSFAAENLGLTGGIGNRWQWKSGFTLGLDWIRINVPLLETHVKDHVLKDINDQSDREDIKDIIRTLNRVPTVVILGLNLGYTF